MNIRLFLCAFLLAIGTLTWGWISASQSKALAIDARQQRQRCEALMQTIDTTVRENENSVTVMGVRFDAARDVSQKLSQNGFAVGSVSATKGQTLGRTKVQDWSVDLPPISLTLQQAINTIVQLQQSKAHYRVQSLQLARSGKASSRPEKWEAALKIRFFKRASKN